MNMDGFFLCEPYRLGDYPLLGAELSSTNHGDSESVREWYLDEAYLQDTHLVGHAEGMCRRTWRVLGDPTGYVLLNPDNTVIKVFPLNEHDGGGTTYGEALASMALAATLDVAAEDR